MRAMWLPDKLRDHGVKVQTHDGWGTRGSSVFDPKVCVAHHTAMRGSAIQVCINGRPDLAGPLCQVVLDRQGVAHVIASGKANHAGNGGWRGWTGNTRSIGIEGENDGVGERWPSVQLDAFPRAAAACCDGMGQGAEMVCAHREWTPRKIDPAGIDMDSVRAAVARHLTGSGGFLMALSDAEQQELLNKMRAVTTAVFGEPGKEGIAIQSKYLRDELLPEGRKPFWRALERLVGK